MTIGGSLIGGNDPDPSDGTVLAKDSGEIYAQFGMGAVKIGHDLQGGIGAVPRRINTFGAMGNVTIGGSLIGASFSGAGGYIWQRIY